LSYERGGYVVIPKGRNYR